MFNIFYRAIQRINLQFEGMVGVETLLGVATKGFGFPLLILILFLACKLSLESLFSIEATTEPVVKL